MRKTKLSRLADELNVQLAPTITTVLRIKPQELVFSPAVRRKCMTCGAYKRKRACPPYSPSLKDIKKFFKGVKYCYMIIAWNDGTKAWWVGEDKQREITLAPKKERGLKGVSMGVQSYCTRLLKEIHHKNKGKVKVFGPGPCHRCRDCMGNDRCIDPPPIPSMESWGMNVFEMLDKFDIEYQNPVIDFLLGVSMVAVLKEE